MIHELSCGAVIWRKINNKSLSQHSQNSDEHKPVNSSLAHEFLVLKHSTKHWAFAKGHVEGNETELETARREIREETGLEVTFHSDFRETNEYSPYPGIDKTVIYFLAEAASDATVRIQPEEIRDFLWLPFEEAKERLSFPNDQKILREAEKKLQSLGL